MSRKHTTHLNHRESETNTQAPVNSKHGSAFKLGVRVRLSWKDTVFVVVYALDSRHNLILQMIIQERSAGDGYGIHEKGNPTA